MSTTRREFLKALVSVPWIVKLGIPLVGKAAFHFVDLRVAMGRLTYGMFPHSAMLLELSLWKHLVSMYPKDQPQVFSEELANIGYPHVYFSGVPVVSYEDKQVPVWIDRLAMIRGDKSVGVKWRTDKDRVMKDLADQDPIDMTPYLRKS